MPALPFSVTLLTIVSVLVFLGLGQRILDRMRLTDLSAILILFFMIIGHFLPTLTINPYLAINLGGFIPIGIASYLLITTSQMERKRTAMITLLTFLLILATDKLLPAQPGWLDPTFSAGIFTGILATFLGRSRRGAFIAGLLGLLLVDLTNILQLRFMEVNQQIILAAGGLFSSMVICAFLAVIIVEIIGETREILRKRNNSND